MVTQGSESGADLDGTVANPNVVAPPAGAGVPSGAGGTADPAPGVAGTGGQGVGGATPGTNEVERGDQPITRQDLVYIFREAMSARQTGGPTPRTVLAVPEPFATQGVSTAEYARFGTYLKAVKVSPPEKWGMRRVLKCIYSCLSCLSSMR